MQCQAGRSGKGQACGATKNVIKLYGDGSLAWVYAALGSTCARSTAGGSNRSGKRSRGGDGSDKAGGARKSKGG